MAYLFDPYYQAVNSSGQPQAGAKLYFYQTGTSTPITTYQDAAAATPHAHPVEADAKGLFPNIFIATTAKFKTTLTTSAGLGDVILTTDPHSAVPNAAIADLGGGVTVGGSANAITITSSTVYTALASNIRFLFKPPADNTSATVNLNLDGLGNKAVRKRSGTSDAAVAIADLQQGQEAEVVYDSTANSAAGAWILLNPHNITFETTQGIIGTTTNDSAAAGRVGEYKETIVLSGAAVSLTTATAADVATLSLTAGDWDTSGVITFSRNAATSVTSTAGYVTATSATNPAPPADGKIVWQHTARTGEVATGMMTGIVRFSVASTTSIYLGATSTFTVNTTSAYGIVSARRAR